MVVAGDSANDVRPARSRRAVLSMIGELAGHAAPKPAPEMSFAEQLQQIQRIARPGSALFLVSDFHDALENEALEGLRRLVRHVQVTAIAINDPLEQELPAAGRYVVADAQGRAALNTGDSTIRQRFREDFDTQAAALTQAYQGLRVPVIRLSTATPPLPILQRYFPSR